MSPLKVFEYLAASVPVVSTPLPACIGIDGVAVASSTVDFAAAISTALALKDGDRLRRSADVAAWSRRIEPLLRELDNRGLRRVAA